MEAKVIELISEHFGILVAEITPSLELHKDLNATDLEIADFLQMLEKTFNVTIDKDDAASLLTVSDIINYISDHTDEIT